MRSPSTSKDTVSPIDTLRLSDEQWYALVDDLEAKASRMTQRTIAPVGAQGEGRAAPRVPYTNMPTVLMSVEHPEETWSRFRIRPRNLSATGMGFFHGSYMHTGARVITVLPGKQSGLVKVQGIVKRCQLIKGKVHEVGVAFHQPVGVTDLLAFEL